MKFFDSHIAKHVPIDKNQHVDALASLGSATNKTTTRNIWLVKVQWPVIKKGTSDELEVFKKSTPWRRARIPG